MSTFPGQFAHEQAVIREAERQGAEQVTLLYNGHPTPFCGTCGRIICHPDCARQARENEA